MPNQTPQKHVRRNWLVGAVSGVLLILTCLVAAYLAASLVDLVRPGTLIQGRGIQPTAMLAAAFVATAGFWWCLAVGHRWTDMLGTLVLVEALLAGLIFFFSGSTSIDSLFLDWFLGVSEYVGLPWLLAIGVSVVVRRSAAAGQD